MEQIEIFLKKLYTYGNGIPSQCDDITQGQGNSNGNKDFRMLFKDFMLVQLNQGNRRNAGNLAL